MTVLGRDPVPAVDGGHLAALRLGYGFWLSPPARRPRLQSRPRPQWLTADRQQVTEGEPSDLLETGKIDREVESPAAGVAQTAGGPGDTYPVGTVISYIEPA